MGKLMTLPQWSSVAYHLHRSLPTKMERVNASTFQRIYRYGAQTVFFWLGLALVSAYQAEILVEMGCQQGPRPQRQTGGQQANQQPCCVSSKPWWKHSFAAVAARNHTPSCGDGEGRTLANLLSFSSSSSEESKERGEVPQCS